MKNRTLKLASNFRIAATEYAIQANADLGIRDSGKTYTAMKCAEGLLDAGIPIVVYDPVGVWKNIRVGQRGHKGYAVIVAGGDDSADIILTPENAVQIVRAAMKAGVSLIIDLFSPSLANKSKWIKIVQETIDVLMYENKEYGVRHVFLEEAAEFIPQRIQPQQSKVYGSIERLARMGRNSSVGMTIINQRAEEVNKAILELCALVFLHKQVGKNSILSLKKWMDSIGLGKNAEGFAEDLSKQLPALKQGECLVLDTNNNIFFQPIKILPKHTYHPSPEKGKPAKRVKSTVNISVFVKKLNAQLTPKEEKKITIKTVTTKDGKVVPLSPPFTIKIAQQQKQIAQLQKSNTELTAQLKKSVKENTASQQQLTDVLKEIRTIGVHVLTMESLSQLVNKHIKKISNNKISSSKIKIPDPVKSKPAFDGKTGKIYHAPDPARTVIPARNPAANGMNSLNKMIKGVSQNNGISKRQLAVLCGMSIKSSTFGIYYRQLRSEGLIEERSGMFYPTDKGQQISKDWPLLPQTTENLLEIWYQIAGTGSGMARMLKVIADTNGEYVSSEDLASESGLSTTSSTFGIYYRKLRGWGLIDVKKGKFKLSENLKMHDE